MENSYNAVFEKDGDYWIGYVEELPGANSQGETLDEVRENLKEAIALILEVNREIVQQEIEGKEVIREELLVSS